MILKENEYIWKITYLDPNDGYRNVHSYWTDRSKADAKLRTLPKNWDATILQDTLYESENGNFYEVKYREVQVDTPTKEEILKKLTPKERKVLGF